MYKQGVLISVLVSAFIKAVMSGDTLPRELNLIDLALIKPTPHYMHIDGDLGVVDPDEPTVPPRPAESGPVTFTTGRMFLELKGWTPQQQVHILYVSNIHFKFVSLFVSLFSKIRRTMFCK